MREMKDSGVEWIGEIPKNWKICRLKDYAHICNGRDYSEVLDENGDYPVIGSGGQFAKACEPLYQKESVLLGRKGTIDKPLFVDYPFWTVDTMYYTEIKENVSAKYFYYLCTQIEFDFYQYGSAVPSMTQRDLYNVNFPYPTLDEQRRIANYLDRKCSQIDTIIAQQQEVIEKLKAYKLSVITEAVTKGLNPDVPMKDSGVEWIGAIPDFWDVVPLKTCSDILPGYAFSSDDFDTENGTALLRGINVTPNGVRWEDVVYWNKPITEQLREFELVAGDIVVGLDRPWVSGGTRVCWVTQKDLPALLLQRVCRIRAKEDIDSRWIYHWIASKSFQEALSIETTGVSVPHISTKQIGQFSIALPPIEVQHQICDTLEMKCRSVDKMVDKKQAIIDKLTEYKKSLIYEVVTGKKEV